MTQSYHEIVLVEKRRDVLTLNSVSGGGYSLHSTKITYALH